MIMATNFLDFDVNVLNAKKREIANRTGSAPASNPPAATPPVTTPGTPPAPTPTDQAAVNAAGNAAGAAVRDEYGGGQLGANGRYLSGRHRGKTPEQVRLEVERRVRGGTRISPMQHDPATSWAQARADGYFRTAQERADSERRNLGVAGVEGTRLAGQQYLASLREAKTQADRKRQIDKLRAQVQPGYQAPAMVAQAADGTRSMPIDPRYQGNPNEPMAVARPQAAPNAAPNWQQAVVDRYPAIGKAGTPENAAFVEAYKNGGTPQSAMSLAEKLAPWNREGGTVVATHRPEGMTPASATGSGSVTAPSPASSPSTPWLDTLLYRSPGRVPESRSVTMPAVPSAPNATTAVTAPMTTSTAGSAQGSSNHAGSYSQGGSFIGSPAHRGIERANKAIDGAGSWMADSVARGVNALSTGSAQGSPLHRWAQSRLARSAGDDPERQQAAR